MKEILNAKQVQRALNRLIRAVAAQLPKDGRIAVVGVRTRGDIIGRRILESLRKADPDRPVDYGVLDITFYRDDLSRRRGAPLVRATEIDFDLDDAWVLLVDDVLQTGRSVRAALGALYDFGRPLAIRLAVLIDRGGRELPIAADFIGAQVAAPSGQRVQVRLKECDGEEGVFITSPVR
jgi:pyrimidine operon attenuation protein/uracil phosphoribosyltransferase